MGLIRAAGRPRTRTADTAQTAQREGQPTMVLTGRPNRRAIVTVTLWLPRV